MPSTVPNTRTDRPSLQQGQAIVLIALLILVLFGMLGLAIDSGRAYVDRRDQQAAVDAAALAAGDWYENYFDLNGTSCGTPCGTIPRSLQLYENDLRIYGAPLSSSHKTGTVGGNNNFPQDTYDYTFNGNYSLEIVATNTQFNGYEFQFTTSHTLPLVFIQIFGGNPTISVGATATSIVGNQRQTPAILTLSTVGCSLTMQGGGSLTVLGDVYSNGQTCIGGSSNLNVAGNCYGAAGSQCNLANYYCYSSDPTVPPYPQPCKSGDSIGAPNVPAPTLPDPGYLAETATVDCLGGPCYPAPGGTYDRGTYSEMTPGMWPYFHLTSKGCFFLDPGVYTWTAGYKSDANGSLVSNELKSPNEEYVDPITLLGPGTTTQAALSFWNMNNANCAGQFTAAVVIASQSGVGNKHGYIGPGNWGVELTSVRFDQFTDPTVSPNPCSGAPGCRRESAPSACFLVSSDDSKNQVIDVSVQVNAPGAQYYDVYLNPNGCDGNPNNFSYINRFNAPGFTNGVATGPFPNGGAGTVLTGGLNPSGWPCAAVGHTICQVSASGLLPNSLCYAQVRTKNCQPPDDEIPPQCFSSCPAPPGNLSQENAPMRLSYPPFTGGDVANENYCQQPAPAGTGSATAPCQNAKVTPGAVQFYFPAGSCMSQQSQGATFVYSGEQYNWIIIYAPPSNNCASNLNGGAYTQYIGTMYTPGESWSINGGDRSPLAGQVICSTASVSGAAAVGVDFNPNYAPAPPAARLIN